MEIKVKNSRKAFTIMEILVAMLVLFTAITFSNIAIKAFNAYQKQSLIYQNFYVTALSLKDKISAYDRFDNLKYRGEINSISYVVEIKKLIEKRNYIIGQDGVGRNNGDFMVKLYECKMLLKTKNKEKIYKFLLIKQKKIK